MDDDFFSTPDPTELGLYCPDTSQLNPTDYLIPTYYDQERPSYLYSTPGSVEKSPFDDYHITTRDHPDTSSGLHPYHPLENLDATDRWRSESIKLLNGLTLADLKDPPGGRNEKPGYPYVVMLRLALMGHPEKRMSLDEIYKTLEDRFP
jgi:hypothetical protein